VASPSEGEARLQLGFWCSSCSVNVCLCKQGLKVCVTKPSWFVWPQAHPSFLVYLLVVVIDRIQNLPLLRNKVTR
jgi:hypothetical protein